jgi:hypothetical protein
MLRLHVCRLCERKNPDVDASRPGRKVKRRVCGRAVIKKRREKLILEPQTAPGNLHFSPQQVFSRSNLQLFYSVAETTRRKRVL